MKPSLLLNTKIKLKLVFISYPTIISYPTGISYRTVISYPTAL